MIEINYVTSSHFKREEIETILATHELKDGRPLRDVFTVQVLALSVKEQLEIDLATMVMAEVTSAYSQLKVPCIVEHAGLIFAKHVDRSYPGGLTKPMWDSLGLEFITETNSAGEPAIARACVAYCDGASVYTFSGETHGHIASTPRGGREFYWDTAFVPDDPDRADSELTYAEIVEADGLAYKMRLSQSAKALHEFMEYRISNHPALWPG